MEKTTVLASFRFTVELNGQMLRWLQNFPGAWFAEDHGSTFLMEFQDVWMETISNVITPEIHNHFRELGVPDDYMPFIQHANSFRGSFVWDVLLVMMGGGALCYQILKELSQLPSIADGLTKLKDKLTNSIIRPLSTSVTNTLTPLTPGYALLSGPQSLMPPVPVKVQTQVNTTPILALGSQGSTKAHEVHLGVKISRNAFGLTNLGTEPLQHVRLGLFKNTAPCHNWYYGDSYTGSISLLQPKQSLNKPLDEFRNNIQQYFDVSNGDAVYVDSWIEDDSGIYLFKFFLEQI